MRQRPHEQYQCGEQHDPADSDPGCQGWPIRCRIHLYNFHVTILRLLWAEAAAERNVYRRSSKTLSGTPLCARSSVMPFGHINACIRRLLPRHGRCGDTMQ